VACTPHSIHIRRLNSLLNYIDELRHSVNFQIEHHLFPTLSHVHYATVQPIVRQACAEWGIPYVEHPSICAAYGSALRAIAKATLEVSGID
jgi:fatty acid desaturase